MDVANLLAKVVPSVEVPCFLGKEFRRDGEVVTDLLFFSPSRVRVASVVSQPRWERRGAKGRVRNAKWPEAKESSRAFLRKWADAVVGTPENGRFLGSRDTLLDAWDQYKVGCRPDERLRKRQRRLLQAEQREGKSSVPQGVPPGGEAVMPVCAGAGMSSLDAHLDWSSSTWFDVDFSLPLQGLFPCAALCLRGF